MLCVLIKMSTHCKNIRRLYGKITGNNWQPDANPFTVIFYRRPLTFSGIRHRTVAKNRIVFCFLCVIQPYNHTKVFSSTI